MVASSRSSRKSRQSSPPRRLDRRRPLVDQPPARGLELRRTLADRASPSTTRSSRACHSASCDVAAEGAHQPIADRIGAGLGLPVAHQLAEFAARRRRRPAWPLRRAAPAAGRASAPGTARAHRVWMASMSASVAGWVERQQVVADLARARADVVAAGTDVDLVVTQHRLERSHRPRAGSRSTGGPPADRRCADDRSRRGIRAAPNRRSGPVPRGTRPSNVQAMRPPESPTTRFCPGMPTPRRQRQHLVDVARAFQAEQAEIGGLRAAWRATPPARIRRSRRRRRTPRHRAPRRLRRRGIRPLPRLGAAHRDAFAAHARSRGWRTCPKRTSEKSP